MHRITEKAEVIQTLGFQLAFVQVLWWNELSSSCQGAVVWAVKEVGVVKLRACVVEVFYEGKAFLGKVTDLF